MGAYLPELAEYGDAALPLDKLMHRNRHTHCIRHAEEDRSWHQKETVRRVCKDLTGRWREEHSYIVEGRKGTTCAFCGRTRPGGDMYQSRIV